jgi:hypothetical protein
LAIVSARGLTKNRAIFWRGFAPRISQYSGSKLLLTVVHPSINFEVFFEALAVRLRRSALPFEAVEVRRWRTVLPFEPLAVRLARKTFRAIKSL